MATSSTAREWEWPLQRGINPSFVKTVSISPFLHTCMALYELWFIMASVRCVLDGREVSSRGQTNVNKHLRFYSRLWCPYNKEIDKQPPPRCNLTQQSLSKGRNKTSPWAAAWVRHSMLAFVLLTLCCLRQVCSMRLFWTLWRHSVNDRSRPHTYLWRSERQRWFDLDTIQFHALTVQSTLDAMRPRLRH